MHQQEQLAILIKEAGLTLEKIAVLTGVSERTVRRWSTGETVPKKIIFEFIRSLAEKNQRNTSSKNQSKPLFDFIDLFAGIGGIRIPFEEMRGRCVFSSEWDKFAQITYAANFGEIPSGDITNIDAENIPAHDVLLAGFPCQAFSQAGHKKGFFDTRGTMLFEIHRILYHHRPKVFMLENVKQLKGHNNGKTLQVILNILRGDDIETSQEVPISENITNALKNKLNYHVEFQVLSGTDFGIPQKRERLFIVGFNKDHYSTQRIKESFKWPSPTTSKTFLGDILFSNDKVDDKYTISDKLWEGHQRRKREHKTKGNGFGYSLFNHSSPYANTMSARYYKDGSEILIDQSDINKNPRKLCPRECARLQGFPDNFTINCTSDAQAYKQFGNSVTIPVVRAVASSIANLLD